MTKFEREVTLASAISWWEMAQGAKDAEWCERNMWALLFMWVGAPEMNPTDELLKALDVI